jgi:hypothetical protein
MQRLCSARSVLSHKQNCLLWAFQTEPVMQSEQTQPGCHYCVMTNSGVHVKSGPNARLARLAPLILPMKPLLSWQPKRRGWIQRCFTLRLRVDMT